MRKFFSSWTGKLLVMAACLAAVYFINVEVQSYLGRQALAETGIEHLTLEQGIAKASTENKRILVDISAIWCPNCRRLDREVFSNDAVKKEINEKFVFVRLEYESPEGQAFLEKHNTDGFPNLWLLDGKGNAIRQLSVTFDPQGFIKQLE